MKNNLKKGYTLVELIVAVGLFALIMLLSSGAYLLMISLNREAQGMTTGIDNLSFALETMTRSIRTGNTYTCVGGCYPTPGHSFSFSPLLGGSVTSYSLGTQQGPTGVVGAIIENGSVILTDPSVDITTLDFYVTGTAKNDGLQPHVTIVITGTVSYGQGKTQPFSVETGATMRGSDL